MSLGLKKIADIRFVVLTRFLPRKSRSISVLQRHIRICHLNNAIFDRDDCVVLAPTSNITTAAHVRNNYYRRVFMSVKPHPVSGHATRIMETVTACAHEHNNNNNIRV